MAAIASCQAGTVSRVLCSTAQVHVLDDIVARGGNPELIRVLCITVAPPALKQLSEKYPGKTGSGKLQMGRNTSARIRHRFYPF